MTDAGDPNRWGLANTALRTAADRFGDLVAAAPSPNVMATADWTVADTVAHVVSIAVLYVSRLQGTEVVIRVPGLEDMLAVTNVDTVADVNSHVLAHFTERDPGVLLSQLNTAVDTLLATTADPRSTVSWLGNSRVTVGGLFAHLTNELLVHGWDIARALRRPWPMPDAHAALYWDLFMYDMLRDSYGVLLNTELPMPRHPVSVQFRSRYTPTTTLTLGDRRVWIAPPDGPFDARVTFRPARFNLMMFGRISIAQAVLRRDVVVGGPRPWRLPAFLRVVHMPNGRLAPPPARRRA
ncbi:maleylpyruvate isomerase N-terminal domain-containing protein [Micromonospora sp. WMMD710]|uniref:maleylpyruvate isomerase N-terminal domain-containing protein n=1 Tax=Micromonospora sp. WMMD710 TaxID=3016085 RepID=UPI002417F6EC|nr:maleylpyruvate isomerase N-terminal domain-containing protein [Micromonospora sp. WMMD710]MDG4758377.1 maleylpyruvate isomerase N-terminal domain-containing protein [Micromonospora sp. WMMD710]